MTAPDGDAIVAMKIGMVVPARGFQGGVERHAHDLARSLGARGHRVVLIHGPHDGRDSLQFSKPFERVVSLAAPDAARDLDVAYVHKAASVDELASLSGVPLAIVAHDHDLTCVRSHRYLPLGHAPCHRAPGFSCVAHGCVLVRDRAPDAVLPVRLADPFALRRRLLALAARAPLVACSGYVRAGLVAAGVAPDRVRVVHPIGPDDCAAPTPRPSEPRVLAIGQLVRGKGFDLAIAALASLPREVTLDVVGDGPSRAELVALAERVAPGRVRFRGYLPPDRVDACYDAASVVVVPSRWPEPFGMIGIEAMRRGRPVVGVAHGGIPEWLDDGVGGCLVAPGDPRALAHGIRRLLADPTAGDRASTSVRARFSHARTVDAVESLLRALHRREVAA